MGVHNLGENFRETAPQKTPFKNLTDFDILSVTKWIKFILLPNEPRKHHLKGFKGCSRKFNSILAVNVNSQVQQAASRTKRQLTGTVGSVEK